MACLVYKKKLTKPKTKQSNNLKLTKKFHIDRIFLKYRKRKELFKVKDNTGKANTLVIKFRLDKGHTLTSH